MNRLKELRIEKGLLQKDLAEFLGVERTTYVKYENGTSEPSINTLMLLANYFGVTVGYLLGTEEERNIYISGNPGTGKSTIITQSFDTMLQEKTKKSPSISDEDIKFALFGGEGEITDEMWEAVREYAQFVKEKYGKK